MCIGPFDSRFESFLFLSTAVLFMAAFYIFIVQPRDEALTAVMDCMGTDRSRYAYDMCVEELKPQNKE